MREPGAIPDSSYNRVLFKPIQLLGRFTFGDVGDFVERGVLGQIPMDFTLSNSLFSDNKEINTEAIKHKAALPSST
mgnify:CR=1 FL=1